MPDLRRDLAVIEQFEKTPLDLGGKRASQLLRKKRRNRRRQRQRPRHTSADSDGEGGGSGGGDGGKDEGEGEGEGEDENDARRPNKARTARAREREAYKSAQFIEDSDEEYGRDIDAFFEREAELRERTALAAVDSALGTGTMRASGTKKRRRPRGRPADVEDADDGGGGGGGARQAKRRAVHAPSQRIGSDGTQSESESGPESQVSARPAPPRDRRPPKPRPRYRGSATTINEPQSLQRDSAEAESLTATAFLAPDDADVSESSHDVGDQGRNESDAGDDESANHRSSLARLAQGGGGASVPNGSAPRKGRVILSDEEE